MPHHFQHRLVVMALAATVSEGRISTARADAQLEVPSVESLGFSQDIAVDGQGRLVTRMLDRETGYLVTVAESPLLGAREDNVVDPAGTVLYHSESHPGWRRTEGLVPSAWATEIRALPGGKLHVSQAARDSTGHYRWQEWTTSSEAWQCNEPQPLPSDKLNALLRSTQPLIPFVADPADAGKATVKAGANTVVKNCARFGAKGVESLLKATSSALDTGLRCLANLGKTYPGPLTSMWRAHVAQLLAYFQPGAPRPFTIACESTSDAAQSGDHIKKSDVNVDAQALTCVDARTKGPEGEASDYPGMAINLAGPSIADEELTKAHIFHELVHHLGYFHDVGAGSGSRILFDAVYVSQRCCFPSTIRAKTPADRAYYQSFDCRELVRKKHGTPDGA